MPTWQPAPRVLSRHPKEKRNRMPIKIPSDLPAYHVLQREGVMVMGEDQAARQTHTPAQRISFARTIGVLQEYAAPLRYGLPDQREKIYRQMLERIASHRNLYRPDRVEPRKIKRDQRPYPSMRTSRQKARQECLS